MNVLFYDHNIFPFLRIFILKYGKSCAIIQYSKGIEHIEIKIRKNFIRWRTTLTRVKQAWISKSFQISYTRKQPKIKRNWNVTRFEQPYLPLGIFKSEKIRNNHFFNFLLEMKVRLKFLDLERWFIIKILWVSNWPQNNFLSFSICLLSAFVSLHVCRFTAVYYWSSQSISLMSSLTDNSADVIFFLVKTVVCNLHLFLRALLNRLDRDKLFVIRSENCTAQELQELTQDSPNWLS